LELALEIATKSIEEYQPSVLENMMIVVFGNRIATIIKNKGYEISILPRNLEKDEEEHRKKSRLKK